MENIGVFHGLGQSQVEFRIDPDKCARWGVSSHEVNMLLSTALAGKEVSQMVEGGKRFDIVLRWPRRLRESEQAILDLPLDVGYRRVLPGPGSVPNTSEPIGAMPRLRLRDVVSAVGEGDEPGRGKEFLRTTPAVLYRKEGKRLLPIRFSVRGRPLAAVRAEAAKQIAQVLKDPYHIEWSDPSGE
jgi:cobalt-zinc-cadmium resistance protein CzcA